MPSIKSKVQAINMTERYIAKVVKVVDSYTIVINAGADKGIKQGKIFIVVGLGEEIFDPETNVSLGVLEVYRGHARVSHVQEKIATLVSVEEVRKLVDAKDLFSKESFQERVSFFRTRKAFMEPFKPVEYIQKSFNKVQDGDFVILA
jgi:hypothetical protein